MNRERNEKCSRRWDGRDERQDEGGRECDAPIWVTREKTYVVAYEGYALRRVQLDLRKREGRGEGRRGVKYRKKNEKEARSQWWRRKRKGREREKEGQVL